MFWKHSLLLITLLVIGCAATVKRPKQDLRFYPGETAYLHDDSAVVILGKAKNGKWLAQRESDHKAVILEDSDLFFLPNLDKYHPEWN